MKQRIIFAFLLVFSSICFWQAWQQAHRGSIVLSWTSQSSFNITGYYLYRSAGENSPFEQVSPALLPAPADPASSAAYQWTDSGLVPGTLYAYQLEEVRSDGSTRRQALPAVRAESGPWLAWAAAGVLAMVLAALVLQKPRK